MTGTVLSSSPTITSADSPTVAVTATGNNCSSAPVEGWGSPAVLAPNREREAHASPLLVADEGGMIPEPEFVDGWGFPTGPETPENIGSGYIGTLVYEIALLWKEHRAGTLS